MAIDASGVEYDEEQSPQSIVEGDHPPIGQVPPVQAQANNKPAVAWSPKLRDQFVEGWRDSGAPATPEALRAYVASNGGGNFKVINDKGKDKVQDSQGRLYDLIKGVGSAGATKRTGRTTDSRYASTTGASAGKGAKGVKVSGAASGGGGGGTGAVPPVNGGGFNTGGLGTEAQGLFDLLMKRATMSEDIDPNNPIIKAQTDAFNAQGQQARNNYLAQQAEHAGPYGNQRSEERNSAEQLGQSTGAFQAQAMQQELGAKRAQIESALSGAQGFLTEQQRMALQKELTTLQLAQQESQFGRNLGFQNKQLAQQGSQFNKQLAQEGSQFGRSLGQRAYEFDTSRFDDLFS